MRPFLLVTASFLFLNAQELSPVWIGDGFRGGVFDPFCNSNDCLWDQTDDDLDNHITSQLFGDTLDSFAADDFQVSGACWLLDKVFANGHFQLCGTGGVGCGPGTDATVTIYQDSSGMPGTIVKTWSSATVIDAADGDLELELDPAIVLPIGTYWISVQFNGDISVGFWGWTERGGQILSESHWQNPGGGWAQGCTSWGRRMTDCMLGSGFDMRFALAGWAYDDTPPSQSMTLCQNDPLTLSAPNIEGATYAWTGPNGFMSSDQNPTVSAMAQPSDAGTYNLVVTTSGCVSPAQPTTVTVHDLTAPDITSNAPVCETGTLQLFTPAVPGGTYSWTGPNSFTSSLQNPVVTTNANQATHGGTYNLTVTIDGCTTNMGSEMVTISGTGTGAEPSPGANSPCVGETLNLTVDAVGGATYSWIGPDGQVSSDQNPSFSNVDMSYGGEWFVSIISGGCSSPPGSVEVTIKPLPGTPITANDGPQCIGDMATLTASGISGATYHWTGPDGFVDTGASVMVGPLTFAKAGVYTCIAEVDGCFSTVGGTTNLAVLGFFSNAPTSQAQGLDPISLEVVTDCGEEPVSIEWFDDDTNTSFGLNVNPISIDPILDAPKTFRVEVIDNSPTNLTSFLTILAHPDAHDANRDTFNTIDDLYFILPDWLSTDSTFDFDGNGIVDVRDTLFIRPAP